MKCVHSSEVCVMKVKTLDSFSSYTLKSSVKRATKKRATCFATLPQNELRGMLRVVPPFLVARHVRTMVIKRTTSLFNSFSSNVAKQVAHFLLPVLPYLKSAMHSSN